MGRDRHNHSRRRKRARTRRDTRPTRHSSRAADLSAIPWVFAPSALPEHDRAPDGSICLSFRADDGSQRGPLVFDTEGLLTDAIVFVGPPGLDAVSQLLLQRFCLHRRALDDPTFAELPDEADAPPAPLSDTRPTRRRLHTSPVSPPSAPSTAREASSSRTAGAG